ncbi:unnamed protein product [Microthlaspi erraticum]|uniref:Uncharacterized protein n=1 Tax=Microthlaspi erraticum TaxID=1685480 RepID=A0A6D2IYG8_9BRAS|nr:unnamed protein product [Microthlaspi erraticum]
MLGGVEVSPPPQLFPGLTGISNIIVRYVRPDISWSGWSERYRHPTREIQIIPEIIARLEDLIPSRYYSTSSLQVVGVAYLLGQICLVRSSYSHWA